MLPKLKIRLLQLGLKLPLIKNYLKSHIQKEMLNTLSPIQKQISEIREKWQTFPQMPENGIPAAAILNRIADVNDHYHPGRLSSTVYTEYEPELHELLKHIWGMTTLTNPLHAEWPLINHLEAEIINFCRELLNGPEGTVGMITHGGSLSILEACKAYVLYARENRNDKPEIIVPESIHVSFEKAAKILHASLIKIPLNKEGQPILKKLKKAINQRTALIAVSAPAFATGIFDPIEEIANIGSHYGIPCHVDACLGGFLNMFAQDAGFEIPPCDLFIKGVTSISVGTHKYGETPNGTSVLLMKPEIPTPTHVHLTWMGGMYVSPGIEGTRNGAEIATTWAVLCYKGKNYYRDMAARILTLARVLADNVRQIPGLMVPFDPMLSIVVIHTTKGINPLVVAEYLKHHGWIVNILQNKQQKVVGFHFCLTALQADNPQFIEEFMHDLAAGVHFARAKPNALLTGTLAAYPKLQKGIPEFLQKKLGDAYIRMLNSV